MTKSNGISLSFSFKAYFDSVEFSFSADFTSSIGRTYSANQNRFSKLVGKMEIEFTKYKTELYDPKTNKVMKTYYYTQNKVLNTYSQVIYK